MILSSSGSRFQPVPSCSFDQQRRSAFSQLSKSAGYGVPSLAVLTFLVDASGRAAGAGWEINGFAVFWDKMYGASVLFPASVIGTSAAFSGFGFGCPSWEETPSL